MIDWKIFLFVAGAGLLGCQNYNSNTFDEARYGVVKLTGTTPASIARFRSAYEVMQTKCMNCHRHAQWAEYKDENDFVSKESLVSPQQVDQSSLITRIVNYGGTSSDMPQGGSPLSQNDYAAIGVWVEQFGN